MSDESKIKLTIDGVMACCEAKAQEAIELRQKALEDKDLTTFTFQEGKYNAYVQIKKYLVNYKKNLGL